MLESLEDDTNELFKGGTLEMSQESAKLSKENSDENVPSTKNKLWNGITPIITLPKKSKYFYKLNYQHNFFTLNFISFKYYMDS